MIDEDAFTAARHSAALAHAIGQPLDDLSLDELTLRIEALRAEITRLEQARQSKEATRAGAEAFFKL
ncbi:DUF1192 domain-containing protein [Methylovirgula sp. HY1]|uniref:DUF1192 domain-containing protein n=1 Tax=Methylovirgula sp. HY1 TaxID=2822761 RepID=UPI001C5B5D94|nr:DUF1192 domain-containing protein [Methylovirgula sp. HY1]QXX75408.1 hypothetical protein MHY1_02227 [Methylovirgula sp. HY1]